MRIEAAIAAISKSWTHGERRYSLTVNTAPMALALPKKVAAAVVRKTWLLEDAELARCSLRSCFLFLVASSDLVLDPFSAVYLRWIIRGVFQVVSVDLNNRSEQRK